MFARGLVHAVVAATVILGAGCPKSAKRQVAPYLTTPTHGNQQARQRFEETRARFHRDDGSSVEGAQAEEVADDFEAIARQYPDDPIAPHALLYAGQAAIEAGQNERAVTVLQDLVKGGDADLRVRTRAQLLLGIALGYQGRHADALVALEAGAEAVDGESERAEFHAARAEALMAAGKRGPAIMDYDVWYGVATPAEKAYVTERIRTIAAELEARELAQVYEALRAAGQTKGPGVALVGGELAGQLASAGDSAGAQEIRDDIRSARESLGMIDAGVGAGLDSGDPQRLGAILSLSGRRNRVGDRSMRGLALAADPFADAGDSAPFGGGFRLSVRDDASGSAQTGAGVEALASEGVIAIIGPDDNRSVERAARAATTAGVPLISLHLAAELVADIGSSVVFHAVHSAERRARALARRAYAQGIRDFAVLKPDNGYGRGVGGAFVDEVERLGGQILVQVSYDPAAKSFQSEVAKLRKPWQALFVPDNARALTLIAPALAAGNLHAAPPGSKVKHGRAIWLLSTADQITPQFLRSAGRYSKGALFAPGFYADRTDPVIADFTSRYERSFGRPPIALDAYAYDAAWAVRHAVDRGVRNRRELVEAIRSSGPAGLTGTVVFDDSGRRRDDGILYQVEEVRPEQFELRAVRR